MAKWEADSLSLVPDGNFDTVPMAIYTTDSLSLVPNGNFDTVPNGNLHY